MSTEDGRRLHRGQLVALSRRRFLWAAGALGVLVPAGAEVVNRLSRSVTAAPAVANARPEASPGPRLSPCRCWSMDR